MATFLRMEASLSNKMDYKLLHPFSKFIGMYSCSDFFQCQHCCVMIDVGNPSIYTGIHAPKGCFCIQFWIRIPQIFIDDVIARHRQGSIPVEIEKDIVYVHILSKIPEALDLNQFSLFEVYSMIDRH